MSVQPQPAPEIPKETPKEAARRLAASQLRAGFEPQALHAYLDVNGKHIYWRIRAKNPDTGEKWIRPMRFNGTGYELGEPKFESGKPLYRLRGLVTSPGVPVWLVEGENCADKLAALGLTATTCGAVGSVDKADWQPLAARDVIVWPDNDEPGRRYAKEATARLQAIGCQVKWVDIDELNLPPKGDCVDWIEKHPKASKADIEALPIKSIKSVLSFQGDTEEWDAPILFGETETPDIPTSSLPSWLGDYADAVAKSTQTPSGLAVMQGLSTVATCLQKKFVVSPFGDDYVEPLSLWTATALPPASRKTAVVSAMTGPLTAWETDQAEKMQPAIAKAEASRAVNLKRIEKLQADAAKTNDSQERDQIIHEITQLKQETPDEVRPPRLWTGDVTPERLQGLMVEQGERMALLSDEGGIFEVMAGLYSDGRANIDVFLQAHAGKAVRVDRGSRTAYLNRPALTFGLAVQPQIIIELSQGSKRRFRGTGALARFLYCIPKSNIGHRDVTKRTIIPVTTEQKYKTGIYGLLDLPVIVDDQGVEKPRILRVSQNALNAWLVFSQYIEENQGEGKPFAPIQDWTGKLPGAALRIAGICHVVERGGDNTVIERDTMERALDLCDLLIKHVQAAFAMMSNDQATEDAKHVLAWIRVNGELRFRQNDCHRASHGRFKKVDRLKEALTVLIDRNIISEPDTEKKLRGRPSIWFSVNPAVLEDQ